MSDTRVIAYIPTPCKGGDLVALLNNESGWELTVDVDDTGTLVVKA